MSKKSDKRNESGDYDKDIRKSDKELDRLGKGRGQGGDDTSELLAKWAKDVDKG